MAQFNLYFTKQDQAEMFAKIEAVESNLNMKLDWKKLKRMGGDTLATYVQIIEQEAARNVAAGMDSAAVVAAAGKFVQATVQCDCTGNTHKFSCPSVWDRTKPGTGETTKEVN